MNEWKEIAECLGKKLNELSKSYSKEKQHREKLSVDLNLLQNLLTEERRRAAQRLQLAFTKSQKEWKNLQLMYKQQIAAKKSAWRKNQRLQLQVAVLRREQDAIIRVNKQLRQQQDAGIMQSQQKQYPSEQIGMIASDGLPQSNADFINQIRWIKPSDICANQSNAEPEPDSDDDVASIICISSDHSHEIVESPEINDIEDQVMTDLNSEKTATSVDPLVDPNDVQPLNPEITEINEMQQPSIDPMIAITSIHPEIAKETQESTHPITTEESKHPGDQSDIVPVVHDEDMNTMESVAMEPMDNDVASDALSEESEDQMCSEMDESSEDESTSEYDPSVEYKSASENQHNISGSMTFKVNGEEQDDYIQHTLYTPGKNLKCDECNEPFHRHSDFIEHFAKEHNVNTPYQCDRDQCNKSYVTRCSLIHHIRKTHLGVTKFECDICGKRFYEMGTFRHHAFVHTGEKPYECSKCSKSFNKKSRLNAHKKTHNGERAFECEKCHHRYWTQHALKRHNKEVHVPRERQLKLLKEGDVFDDEPHIIKIGKNNKVNKVETHSMTEQSTMDPLSTDTSSTTNIIADPIESQKSQTPLNDASDTKLSESNISSNDNVTDYSQLYVPGVNLTCHECDKPFLRQIDFKNHMKRQHRDPKPYQCSQCEKCYTKRSALIFHTRKIHNNERRYQCDVCNREFYEKFRYEHHRKIMHLKETPYECSYENCTSSFKTTKKLRHHIRYVHEKKQRSRYFQCESCPKKFACNRDLTNHIRVHTGERPYQCTRCNKAFKAKSVLTLHEKIHDREREEDLGGDVNTDLNPKENVSTTNVKSEMVQLDESSESAHSESGDEYQPTSDSEDEAVEAPNNKETNAIHHSARTVSDSQLYAPGSTLKCVECREYFDTHSDFVSHMRKQHGDRKPYECNQCTKSYTTRCSLIHHIRRFHEGIYKYECDICHKRFYEATKWRFHCRKHKALECSKCELFFDNQTLLNDHIRSVHADTGEMLFQCSQCRKTFTEKEDLAKHERIIHNGERPYECDQCHKRFRAEFVLRSHKRLVHGANVR